MNQASRIKALLAEKKENARAFRQVVASCRQSIKDNQRLVKAIKRQNRELEWLRGYSQAMSEMHECAPEGPMVQVWAEPLKATEINAMYAAAKVEIEEPEARKLWRSSGTANQ